MSIATKIGKDLAALLEEIEEQYESGISELEDNLSSVETHMKDVNGSKISRLEARVHSLDVDLEKEQLRRIDDIQAVEVRLRELEADPNEE